MLGIFDCSMSKTAIVTGANTGIGKEIARGIAEQGLRVVLACRNADRAEAARHELVEETGNHDLKSMILDLGSLDSIRKFSDNVHGRFDRVDVLVNNAGVSHEVCTTTADGFEATFGVNFLGPFLLTNLLMDLLLNAAPARIVNVASSVHYNGHIDRNDPEMNTRWENRKAYANSKLADVLFTLELSRRWGGTGVTANCFNPGLVRSEFFRNYHPVPFMLRIVLKLMGKTPKEGADTGVYLATAPEVAAMTAGYYEQRKPKEPSAEARDEELARWLWDYASQKVELPVA